MREIIYRLVNGDTLTFDVSSLDNDEILKDYINPFYKGDWVVFSRENNGVKKFHTINPINVIEVTVNNI